MLGWEAKGKEVGTHNHPPSGFHDVHSLATGQRAGEVLEKA